MNAIASVERNEEGLDVTFKESFAVESVGLECVRTDVGDYLAFQVRRYPGDDEGPRIAFQCWKDGPMELTIPSLGLEGVGPPDNVRHIQTAPSLWRHATGDEPPDAPRAS